MTINFPFLRSLAMLIAPLYLAGCQALVPGQTMENFNSLYSQGHYQAAAETALHRAGGLDDGRKPELLWSLQASSALTASGQFELSNRVLDNAEELAQQEDLEGIARKGMETLTATLINNNVNRYSPTVYDGVMVNTYKALNNILLQDAQNARIEFNRAADRQRRAEDHFRKKIAQDQQKQEQAQQQPVAADAPKSSREEAIQSVYAAYPELQQWQVYPDYINPYTDYLHGLHFMLGSQGRDDYGKARDSLRRVAGMSPNNPAIKTDLMVVDKLIRGEWRKQNLNPSVWVIFENGLGPEIEEELIPIPLFVVSDKVEYSQIALPRLKVRDQAYTHLELYGGGKSLGKTELLASIDRVVQTEFKKDFPYKVTEAVVSTITKGMIQYQARKELGAAGSLMAAVYQMATTRADTRIWTALPKDIQVARVRPPADRQLRVSAPGLAEPLSIELPDSQFSIVYVKATTPGSQPVYQVASYQP